MGRVKATGNHRRRPRNADGEPVADRHERPSKSVRLRAGDGESLMAWYATTWRSRGYRSQTDALYEAWREVALANGWVPPADEPPAIEGLTYRAEAIS
jgi:hypothetical protein